MQNVFNKSGHTTEQAMKNYVKFYKSIDSPTIIMETLENTLEKFDDAYNALGMIIEQGFIIKNNAHRASWSNLSPYFEISKPLFDEFREVDKRLMKEAVKHYNNLVSGIDEWVNMDVTAMMDAVKSYDNPSLTNHAESLTEMIRFQYNELLQMEQGLRGTGYLEDIILNRQSGSVQYD